MGAGRHSSVDSSAVPGSNPEHTIYAFIVKLCTKSICHCVGKRTKIKRGRARPIKNIICWVGVVMGADSCSRGRVFESQHRLLDSHFLTVICSKNCITCWRLQTNVKEAGDGPIRKIDRFT